MTETDVLVVGGGPAGLAAAVALRAWGADVTLVEREPALGGIARHSDHTGYGIREFGRPMRGPAYARAWARRAERAGVDVHTLTTVTDWAGGGPAGLEVTTTAPGGRGTLRARAIVLATGTRERPRSARLVPGDRPSGVLTTGSLQRLVASDQRVGSRAVVVGAEHVSFSAVMTLAHARCRTVAVVTPQRRHQTYPPLAWVTAGIRRVPVLTGTSVSRVNGRAGVESVELTDHDTGSTRLVACDTIVFTGDWIPDHELARRGGLAIDRGTRAPQVDGGLRTSTPGVFAAGNVLHGAETAGVCARSGSWVAQAVGTWLDLEGADWPPSRAVPIDCEPPLRWVSPNALVPGQLDVPHGHLLARCSEFAPRPTLVVHQGSARLFATRLRHAVPTRSIHLPTPWLRLVEPGVPVRLGLG